MSIELSTEFTCDECGEILSAKESTGVDRYREPVLMFAIKPCEKCKSQAYEEGVDSMETGQP